jgi:hypothetical protein
LIYLLWKVYSVFTEKCSVIKLVKKFPACKNSLHKFPLLVLNQRQFNQFTFSAPLFSTSLLMCSERCDMTQAASLRLFKAEIRFRSQDLWWPN